MSVLNVIEDAAQNLRIASEENKENDKKSFLVIGVILALILAMLILISIMYFKKIK